MQSVRIAGSFVGGVLLLVSVAASADTQVRSATLLTNDPAVGTATWTTFGFPATAALTPSGTVTSQYLETTGYGFTLPANAIVQGIQVQINRSAIVVVGTNAQDHLIRLFQGGSVKGNDRSVPGSWPATNTPAFYGGPIDLWNTNWTAADINAADFGVGISVDGFELAGATFINAFVHAVQVTVTYYVPCPATVDLGGCDSTVEKASLKVDESKPGKEKVQASLGSGAALTQSQIGNFVGNTGAIASLCIYDSANALVSTLAVDAGGNCGDNPCWKSSGGDYPDGKGMSYKWKDGAQGGITQIKLSGGDAGKSKAQFKADNKNGYLALGTAAALDGDPTATIQIRTSSGMCLSSSLTDVSKNADGKFQAKK